jgi:copper chaperone CopZ
MTTTKLDISGMSCDGCVRSLNIALNNFGVKVNEIKIGFVDIKYDENTITKDSVINVIEEAGFKVENEK